MRIDFHTHVFPDAFAADTVARLAAAAGVAADSDGTTTALLHRMNAAAVDRSVLCPVATRPGQEEGILRWLEDLPRDRFEPFGALHPRSPDAPAFVRRLAREGVRGVKLHPDYQGFYVDDPAVDPVYAAAVDSGLIVLCHAGLDIGLPDPVHAPPARIAAVLDRHPGLRLVLAHLGGYQMWDEVERFLVGRDCWFDTAYVAGRIDPGQFIRIIRAHGVDRVLFGSDSPWEDPAVGLRWLATCGLDPAEIDAVGGGNAARLLSG